MSQFNSDKVYINYRNGYEHSNVIIPRRYTLTHSDLTAELFLTVGSDFATEKISAMRDEVFGEWSMHDEHYLFNVAVQVDGANPEVTKIRHDVFLQELPLALKTIRYGDSHLFIANPELDYSYVIVYFQSQNPQYNHVENYGHFKNYDPDELSRYF